MNSSRLVPALLAILISCLAWCPRVLAEEPVPTPPPGQTESSPPAATAQSPSPEARRMDEILSHKRYRVDTGKISRSTPPQDDSPKDPKMPMSGLAAIVGDILQVLAWVVLFALIAFIVYIVVRKIASRGSSAAKPEALPESSLVHEIVGEVIDPAVLPSDIGSAAWKLWSEQSRYEDALRMLYQGTLLRLLRSGVPLTRSNTERECLRLLARHPEMRVHQAWIRDLVSVWQDFAYGRRLPDSSLVHQLCRRWSAEFGPDAKPSDSRVLP